MNIQLIGQLLNALIVYYTGCIKKTRPLEIKLLLEFECLSTMLNPRVRKTELN